MFTSANTRLYYGLLFSLELFSFTRMVIIFEVILSEYINMYFSNYKGVALYHNVLDSIWYIYFFIKEKYNIKKIAAPKGLTLNWF